MEPRAARPADLQAAAAWLALDETPPAWTEDLETGGGFAIDEDGSPAGLVLLRCWGRVVALPLLLVDPGRRGRGHGRRLVAAAREEVLRRDARCFGLEADPFDHGSLSCLLRMGFKAGPPLIELDWDLPTVEADEPEPAQPPADHVAALAAALDADFEPGDWLERRLRDGGRLLGAQGPAGDWTAAALVEPPSAAGPARLSLLLVDESEPFEALDELAQALASAGLDRVRAEVPARQADALRALLVRGAQPAGSRLRLCYAGFPERSDLRRLLVAPWR